MTQISSPAEQRLQRTLGRSIANKQWPPIVRIRPETVDTILQRINGKEAFPMPLAILNVLALAEAMFTHIALLQLAVERPKGKARAQFDLSASLGVASEFYDGLHSGFALLELGHIFQHGMRDGSIDSLMTDPTVLMPILQLAGAVNYDRYSLSIIEATAIDPDGIIAAQVLIDGECDRFQYGLAPYGIAFAAQMYIQHFVVMSHITPSAVELSNLAAFHLTLREWAPQVQTEHSITKKAQQLEAAAAALAKHMPPTRASILPLLAIMAKHPLITAKGIATATVLIARHLRNPTRRSRDVERVVDTGREMVDLASNDAHPGDLLKQWSNSMHRMDDAIAQLEGYPQIPPDEFVRMIRSIPGTRLRLRKGGDRLAGLRRFVADRRLLRYSAIYSAAAGRLSEALMLEFERTMERRALRQSLEVLRRALDAQTSWQVDLGSRRRLIVQLMSQLSRGGSSTGMSAVDVAREVFALYRDFQFTSERLYLRAVDTGEVEDSQRLIPAVSAAAIEAALYLEEVSPEDSRDWSWRAFLVAELGKSRVMRDHLATARRVRPLGVPETLFDQESDLLSELSRVQREIVTSGDTLLRQSDDRSKLAERKSDTRAELEVVWARMERDAPSEPAYVRLRRDETILDESYQVPQVQRVMAKLDLSVALVELFFLHDALYVSIATPSRERPINLRVNFSSNDVASLWYDYRTWLRSGRKHDSRGTSPLWMTLGDRIFPGVGSHLNDVTSVCFLPHGGFHMLPLHAMMVEGVPIIENWNVFYAPSINTLEASLDATSSTGEPIVLGTASAQDSPELIRLIFDEAISVAHHLDVQALLADSATLEALEKACADARIIHVSSHGRYDHEDPLRSSVLLSDGEFSAGALLNLAASTDLLTLSACATGMIELSPGDNSLGLVPAALSAGVRSVLSTLWNVEASSTRDWMSEFYKHLQNRPESTTLAKAESYRHATLKLMSVHGRDNPYFWAPFVLTGSP